MRTQISERLTSRESRRRRQTFQQKREKERAKSVFDINLVELWLLGIFFLRFLYRVIATVDALLLPAIAHAHASMTRLRTHLAPQELLSMWLLNRKWEWNRKELTDFCSSSSSFSRRRCSVAQRSAISLTNNHNENRRERKTDTPIRRNWKIMCW